MEQPDVSTLTIKVDIDMSSIESLDAFVSVLNAELADATNTAIENFIRYKGHA